MGSTREGVRPQFIAAKSGLGHLVYRHWQMLSTPEMYAAFALVGALGLLLTRGLRSGAPGSSLWRRGLRPLSTPLRTRRA